jgi:tRNA U34 2-thiouridine synthase MnmA/TrmU
MAKGVRVLVRKMAPKKAMNTAKKEQSARTKPCFTPRMAKMRRIRAMARSKRRGKVIIIPPSS